MRNLISQRVKNLRPSAIRKYFDIAAALEDVVTLGIGEPDFVTPQHIIESGIQSLRAGHTGYTSNAGTVELRRAIVAYIERLYGLRYDADGEVLVTVGVSEALWLAMRAILDPGDEVLVVEPCFVANPAAVEMAGGVPVMVPTFVEDAFQVRGAALTAAITPRTKAILLSYPNNPTGATMSREGLLEIAAIAEKYDLVVVSDEIYERLIYGTTHTHFATLPGMAERTIVLSGMSKAFAMTGWRIGYVTASAPLMEAMKKLHQYLIMSAPTMGQVAAVEALTNGEADVALMRAAYDARRRLIVEGFNSIGLPCYEPRGAFYAFPSIAHTGLNSDEFCERLLQEQRVALIPGSAFGQSGEGYIRASYATSPENIERALERIGRFMQAQGLAAGLVTAVSA